MTPIFWISGNYYNSHKKWQEICKLINNPIIEIIDPDTQSISDIIKIIKQKSMFDDSPRIIKFQSVPKEYDTLLPYLSLARNDNVFVFCCPLGYYSNRRFNSIKTTNFYKYIVNIKDPPSSQRIFHYPEELSYSECIEWVKKIFIEHKKKTDDAELSLLIGYKGRNLDILYSEIIKICDYSQDKKITNQDIEDCCLNTSVKTTWDLLDSLWEGNYEDSIINLQKFYNDPNLATTIRGEIQNLLGAMVYTLNFVLFLKAKCGTIVDVTTAQDALKELTKKDGDGRKQLYNYYYIKENLSKKGVKNLLQWDNRRMYGVVDKVMQFRQKSRENSDLEWVKLGLVDLAIEICCVK